MMGEGEVIEEVGEVSGLEAQDFQVRDLTTDSARALQSDWIGNMHKKVVEK